MHLSTSSIRELVSKSLQQGRKYFPQPLANIQDREDQESDFLYGVALGLTKMRRRRFRLKRGRNPVQYLVNNGMWTLRRKRVYFMRKRLVIHCQCGKRLKFSQKPCHGTMADRDVQAFIFTTDNDDWLALFDGRKIVQGARGNLMVDIGGGQ